MKNLSELPAIIWRTLPLSKSLQLFIMRRTQDEFLIGLTGIIFDDKDKVLICRHTYRKTPWSLPGGYLKAREHPKEGLEREIKEETGLTVSADERLKTRTDRDSARLDLVYFGRFIGGEFSPSKEVSEANFFAFDSLPDISNKQVFLIKQALDEKKRRRPIKTSLPIVAKSFLSRFKNILGS